MIFDWTLSGFLARAIAMILGFTLHEAAHAFAAYRLGDDTAQRSGRLTLDPRVHLDPFGAILALLFGFGWARPTPVNPWRLRYGPRVGNALVAVAGPLTNLLIAALAAIPWQLGLLAGAPLFVQRVMLTIVALNVILFLFNLIPLAPLDGISVLNGLVGVRGARALAPLQTYGPQILMGLMLIGFISPRLNLLGAVLYPAMNTLTGLLIGR